MSTQSRMTSGHLAKSTVAGGSSHTRHELKETRFIGVIFMVTVVIGGCLKN